MVGATALDLGAMCGCWWLEQLVVGAVYTTVLTRTGEAGISFKRPLRIPTIPPAPHPQIHIIAFVLTALLLASFVLFMLRPFLHVGVWFWGCTWGGQERDG